MSQPKVVFRAVHRDPEGNEETSEREVVCASQEEMLELLCQPWETLPQPEDPTTSDRWKETVGQLKSWMSAMRFELEEHPEQGDGRRWVFKLRPTNGEEGDAEQIVLDPTGKQDEADKATTVDVTGRVDADFHTDGGGKTVMVQRDGAGIQVNNSGMMVWNRDNIYCQVHMIMNLTVNVGEEPTRESTR